MDGADRKFTREEAAGLVSKGLSYTQNSQALAEEKKQWETDRNSLVSAAVAKEIERLRGEQHNQASEVDGMSDTEKLTHQMNQMQANRDLR